MGGVVLSCSALFWLCYTLNMDFSITYLVQRIFYRIGDFFHHWYVDGSKYLVRQFIYILESFDETLAIGITARHFFEPLYKDYSAIGRILGVIFRSIRILIGFVIYLLLGAIFALILLAWVATPALLVLFGIKNAIK